MTSPRWPAWANAAILLVASFGTMATLSLQAKPGQVKPGADVVAVSFPWWWGAGQSLAAVAAADVAIVRLTPIPSVIVVQSGDRNGLARLRQAGAWLVIDAVAVTACLGVTANPGPSK